MNMLKFGYGMVLDGLPDIPEFHFFLGSGHPQTRCHIHISEILEFLERHMSGNQACRCSPHGPIEKEMCHLKAEKNKLNHSGCLLSQILLLICICIFFLYYRDITPLCP